MTRTATLALLMASAALAACDGGLDGEDRALPGSETAAATAPAATPAAGPTMQPTTIAFQATEVDAAAFTAEAAASTDRTPAILRAQVLLDRARFRPGVIDGKMGENVRQAIAAYESANGLPVDGALDEAVFAKLTAADTGSALAEYTITAEDVAGPFEATIPSGLEAQAALKALSYTNAAEALGEKFHMTPELLQGLNPGVDLSVAGGKIVVADIVPGKLTAQVARIEVDKGEKAVKAFDGAGKLLAFYPATIGSDVLPTPDGEMTVTAVAPRPNYTYDPSRLNSGKADKVLTIQPGPNNPVGAVWIDLSKDTYGIHGTPEPHLVGKRSSSGCVRLTNWDVTELSGAVKKGVPVVFVS